MKYLLDTHILLWSLLDPSRLAEDVSSVLESRSSELCISPISLWEILILAERGRINLKPDAESWIRNMLREIPFREIPLTSEVAIESRNVDLPHRDPADRFLAATAIVHDLILISADDRLLMCRDIKTLSNK